MRGIRRRFCVGIASLALAWSHQTAQAQPEPRYYPPPSQQQPAEQSAGLMQSLNPFRAAEPEGGNWAPQMMSGQIQQAQYQQPAGPPPAYNPHPGPGGPHLRPDPGLDMYRYGFQQTTNQNGLWYKEMLTHSRTFTGNVEYILPVYDSPGADLFGYGGIETGIVATNRVPPYWFTSPRSPGEIETTAAASVSENELLAQRYFPTRQFAEMFDNMSGGGIRLDFGMEHEDGSGWSLDAWYGGSSHDTFQRGDDPTRSYTPIPGGDPFSVLGNDPLFLFELNALTGSLPINNGSGVADRIVFDTLFEMQYHAEAWGSGLQFYRSAIAKGDGYRIRPVLGLRYVNIREGFKFRGRDSGGEYEFLNYDEIDEFQEFETLNNLDFGLASDAGETGETGLEGRPVPDTFNSDTVDFIQSGAHPFDPLPTNPYETQVSASNHAHAAGPEIGLEAELGGDETQLTLKAVAGLTATKETLQLDGFGVYNHFLNNVDPDDNPLTPDGGEMGTGVGGLDDEDTRFSDRSSTTHVSPLLDLSVRFESRLFQYVPGVNQYQFFNQARFATSYGFLYVGNLSRPQDSVEYTTFPTNPKLDPNRSGWTMQQWTFGVSWER